MVDGSRRVKPPFGSWVLGNRWDAVGERTPDPLPRVSVIVTHFDQPRELERMLHALSRQDYPAHLVQLIVADDGSPDEPVAPDGVELVRQDDRGFRAAAVRNLGASRASGDVLCFLDADTAPEPGYVRAMTRLPALLPEAVTVGRRRHADFATTPSDAPLETAGPAHALDEPEWLADAYSRSRNLLDADDRSYRYVIGAAFACSRWFFAATGGFDESFDTYGGEDWEWAHRAWQHGAVFAHVPDAVAWHDGPEWAGRMADPTERRRQGNAQSLLLSAKIPVAGSHGRGLLTAAPDVVFRLESAHERAQTFVCVDSVLAALPHARVELAHGASDLLYDADPRVGHLDPEHTDARVIVHVVRPFALLGDAGALLAERLRTLGWGDEGALDIFTPTGELVARAESRRARERRLRWGSDETFLTGAWEPAGAVTVREAPYLEAYVGGWGGADELS